MIRLCYFQLFLLLFSSLTQAQEKSPTESKISPSLKTLLYKEVTSSSDSLDLVCTVTNEKDFNITNEGYLRILYSYPNAHVVVCRVPGKNLNVVLSLKDIVFADVVKRPKEEITTGANDPTANHILFAHYKFPAIKGQSIVASIKEQRFDTTDIDIKGRWINSNMAATTSSSHASIMATLLAGAGNSSPYAQGVAPAANVTSSSFAILFPDHDSVYQRFNISLQNHSYGTDIENYYGSQAVAYDKSVVNNPSLVHVFSSGNAGTTTTASGPYTGVQGYANLTGNFKLAKNIITVGAIDSFLNVMAASSKGPAFDGRVKPELVAYGEGGSSGAAALVSGTVALLQQVYKQNNSNNLPSAALVKAVLLNSATDIGNRHVDYSTGYGSLNTFEALKTIKENRFVSDNISNTQVKTYPVTIPANTSQLKITIAWTDLEAPVNTSKALVNNIDLLLRNSSTGEAWLPWVLNKFPHKDSLALPAVRKLDTLNNVEQITVDFPVAGNYIIEVRGTSIATLNQPFAFSYQIDTLGFFEWRFPSSIDPLPAGQQSVVRWETNVSGTGTLEYRVDNGTWQTISSNVDLGKKYFKWNAPSVNTKAQIRIVTQGNAIYTSDTFVISQQPNINVGFNCADSVLLYWNRTAAAYKVYKLGDKYLEPFANSNDTTIVISKSQHQSLYYSVAPVIDNKEGLRSFTINYQFQGVQCYFKNFLVQLRNNTGELNTEIGTLYNISKIRFQKLTANGYVTIKEMTPVTTNIVHFDISLTTGVNTYRVQIVLSNGQQLFSNPESIYYFLASPVIVFPNPARQNEPIRIIAADQFEYSVSIYDALGRIVYQTKMDNTSHSIEPLRLSKGVYFIRSKGTANNFYSEKLVVY